MDVQRPAGDCLVGAQLLLQVKPITWPGKALNAISAADPFAYSTLQVMNLWAGLLSAEVPAKGLCLLTAVLAVIMPSAAGCVYISCV